MLNLKNCIVDKIQTLKDYSIKITLITRELTAEQMALLFLSVNKEVEDIQIEEENKESKSPSTRLRNVLYVFWEQSQKEKYPEFEVYYRAKMEKIIEQVKEKLTS